MVLSREPHAICTCQVECALCGQLIEISIEGSVEPETGTIELYPGYENMWAHRFVHEERGELERRVE